MLFLIYLFGFSIWLEAKCASIWVLLLFVLMTQFLWKSSRLLLTLLTLESLMLFISVSWTMMVWSSMVPLQLLLVVFMVSVSEAALGLALLISFVRSEGNDQLQSS